MQSAPRVSVIVPNYNCARFLPRCLDSILAQTYKSFEVQVVDGGSTDGSVEILEAYARRCPVLRYRSESDEGAADAINKGIRLTQGPFLTWINSDDALDSRALERAMLEFERDDRLALVYGSVLNVSEHGAILELNRGLKIEASDLAVFDFVPQAGAVFRRYDGLMLNETLEWGFDWELWIELSKRGSILNIDHIVGYCIVSGRAERKSDRIIPRRTLELAGIARRHSSRLNTRVALGYLAATLGYCLMPLGLVDRNYYRRIIRWVGRLGVLLLGRSEKGVML